MHIRDPERRAARSLTKQLRAHGVSAVTMDAGAGAPPSGLRRVVTRRSASFEVLLRHMNRRSRNFYAEVLGKWLGGLVHGGAGSIAKGARAIEALRRRTGRDRRRPRLLRPLVREPDPSAGPRDTACASRRRDRGDAPSGPGSPTGDQGTLEDRLVGVKVRAKTGTLIDDLGALRLGVAGDRKVPGRSSPSCPAGCRSPRRSRSRIASCGSSRTAHRSAGRALPRRPLRVHARRVVTTPDVDALVRATPVVPRPVDGLPAGRVDHGGRLRPLVHLDQPLGGRRDPLDERDRRHAGPLARSPGSSR